MSDQSASERLIAMVAAGSAVPRSLVVEVATEALNGRALAALRALAGGPYALDAAMACAALAGAQEPSLARRKA